MRTHIDPASNSVLPMSWVYLNALVIQILARIGI